MLCTTALLQLCLIYLLLRDKKCEPLDPNEIIYLVTKWANAFVRYVRYFHSNLKGSEKMNKVISLIQDICKKYNIDIDITSLKAIIQEAYEKMIEDDATSKEQQIIAIKEAPIVTSGYCNAIKSSDENIAFLDDDTKIIKED